MPIDKYIQLISSCSVVIMNHTRQQALGNIITMMYMGATIFLKEENPIYMFFKKHNAVIFTIYDLEKNHDLLDYRLSVEEIEINKRILKQHWSRKIALQRTKQLLEKAVRR